MSLGDHIDDLRRRVILAVVGIIPIFIGALFVGQAALELLITPVQQSLRDAGQPSVLQATGPLETFGAYVRVSIVITILVASPWILYQLWKFVAPGLYTHERRFVHLLVPLSAGLTLASAAFLYYIMIPVVLAFFVTFGSGIGKPAPPAADLPPGITLPTIPVLDADPINPPPGSAWINRELSQLRVNIAKPAQDGTTPTPTIVFQELVVGTGVVQQYRISEYIKLFMTLAIALAIAFQMPIVVLLLGWAGIVDRAFLARYRRHIAAACAIAGALLTPADPISMVALAIPLYFLFEFGMVLLRFLPASRVAGERQDAEPEDIAP